MHFILSSTTITTITGTNTTTGFRNAPRRIRCMIFKQQFKLRVQECKQKLSLIEKACDDVKMSIRFKKVSRADGNDEDSDDDDDDDNICFYVYKHV